MGQQGFQWREQWGLEGADMQYTCGAAATNARARARGWGGVGAAKKCHGRGIIMFWGYL